MIEQTVARDDPDPKALACYGLLLRHLDTPDDLLLRFCDGRPVSGITTQYLQWCCDQLAARGTTALILIWDNAPWHVSRAVRRWIRAHNRAVKEAGSGVRILARELPIKSPWLNPIEPKWVHGKRAVSESDRLLTATELEDRVYQYFGGSSHDHLIAQPVA
jgi:DDE superfamily endonuclease